MAESDSASKPKEHSMFVKIVSVLIMVAYRSRDESIGKSESVARWAVEDAVALEEALKVKHDI